MLKQKLVTWDGAEGWIYNWFICGFFDSGLQWNPNPHLFQSKPADAWTADLLKSWGGEASIHGVPIPAGGASVEWLPVSLLYGPKFSLLDLRTRYAALDKAMGDLHPDPWRKCYYALALIESDRDTTAMLHFSGWDGCRLWVNGTWLFDEHSYHHIILDMERVPLRLKKGTNTILVKLDRDGCAARVVLKPGDKTRLLNPAGAPLQTGTPVATETQLRRWALERKTQTPFRGKTPAQLKAWQTKGRGYFQACLGPVPAETKGPVKLVSRETTADGIERRLYHMPSEGASVVPFYVMIPAKAKRNGKYITVAHGHGGNQWREIAGVPVGAPPWGPDPRLPYTGDHGIELARRGFVTSVCCERAFSDRNDHQGTDDPCDAAAMLAMAQGATLPMLHMNDIRRMTKFVMRLPEVKGMSGPGITGLSGGGTMTYLLGAYDTLYKAVAVWCGICRYRDYAQDGGCGMQVVPRLWPAYDVGELMGLIAPRPLLLGQGTLDSTFTHLTVQSVHADALRAYKAAGVPARVSTSFGKLAHQVDTNATAAFFEANL
ncbi:MAG: hypothetical protein ABIF71_14625 [Planctomycetota bacterium]